ARADAPCGARRDPRPPRRPAASCRPCRSRSRVAATCPDGIHVGMANEPPSGGPPRDPPRRPARPEYKVYRARPALLDRLTPRRPERGPFDRLRRRAGKRPTPPTLATARRSPLRRAVKWVAIALGAWILLSVVIFMVSAQLAPGVSSSAENALSSGGSL